MQVTDENGDQWTLSKGCPGYSAATHLKGMGYEQVRLPLRVLLGGQLAGLQPAPTKEELTSIMTAWLNADDPMVHNDALIAYAGLYDQWTALEQAGLHMVD